MINNIEIGKRIKERREELGLTIQYIADKVKVHKSTIQRYETGNIKDIKIPVIESIAKALQVNPMWIIGDVNIKEMHSAEYEQVTYLSNIYFQGVMKWSEDKLLSENDTIILREHFSDLLLRYKDLIESYVYATIHWKNSKGDYKTIYKDRLSDEKIMELFFKQELEQKIKSLTDWVDALPNWISRNKNEISATKEDYLTPLAAHDKDGIFPDEDMQHDLDIMKNDKFWD